MSAPDQRRRLVSDTRLSAQVLIAALEKNEPLRTRTPSVHVDLSLPVAHANEEDLHGRGR